MSFCVRFENITALLYDNGAFPCRLQKLSYVIALEVSMVSATALCVLLSSCGESDISVVV